jgi:hypothetical protein
MQIESSMRLKHKCNVTQLCFKMLLYIYDNKVAYSRDTPVWRYGGLYSKTSTSTVTFQEALSFLIDRGMIRSYKDPNNNFLYVEITSKAQMMMEQQARQMMILFA